MSQQESSNQEEVPNQQEEAENAMPEEKSRVKINPQAPDHLPEFDVGDEVSARVSSGGVSRKVVARISKREVSQRQYVYQLKSPADTSKWYRESDLDWA